MDEMSFSENLDRLLDDPDLSIDLRLSELVQSLNDLDPSLLERVSAQSDEAIGKALFDFANAAYRPEQEREHLHMGALLAAAALKNRADRAGVTVLEYFRLIKVRREMDDV